MSFSNLIKKSFKCNECNVMKCISTSTQQSPAEYCLELVRKNDYEGFLCSLLLPHNLRSAAVAIRAFNTEVATVEDQVSDNKIGLMRIKFWEDTLNAIYKGNPPKNPVSLELSRIIQKHKLSKFHFKRLIRARCDKLNGSIFLNLESVEEYAEQAVASVYFLILEAQGVKDVNSDHSASHLGKAQGLVTLIRSIPHNALKRTVDLPQDILMKHKISSEFILQQKSNKELKDAIFEVSSRAKQHLNKAQTLHSKVQEEAKTIFLPHFIIDNYLEKLRKSDFDVFDPRLQQRNNLLPLKLYWKKLFL